MSSVFDYLKRKINNHSTRKTADALTRGHKYDIIEFRQETSKFLDAKSNTYPSNLIANFKSNQIKNYIILPKVFDNMDKEHVDELNKCVKEGRPPSIVFYGKQGPANDIRILQYGETVDLELLQSYLREDEETEPPSKKLKKALSSDSVTSVGSSGSASSV